MRAANLATSPRLQRVDRLLSDGLWHSTLDIFQGAKVCAVNSCVSELRANGRNIEGHWRKKIFYYRMLPKQAMA